MDIIKENWSGKVEELSIGAGAKTVTLGGAGTLPFLDFEGAVPHPPRLALELHDSVNPDWNPHLKNIWGTLSLEEWIKIIESLSPDLICVRHVSADPDTGNASAGEVCRNLEKILALTDYPLIITGCGNPLKDQEILPALAETAKGRNALIGVCTQDNYRTLAAAAVAGGHSLIAESPLDVNLAKQLNILISDMGLPVNRIVMHHTTGGLGYGLEYCYSIMERCRLAALAGDRMLSSPMLNFAGEFSWNTKEAKGSEKTGIVWETVTGVSYLESGADILILNHPESLKRLKKAVRNFMEA